MHNFLSAAPSEESLRSLLTALQAGIADLAGMVADLGETRGLSEDATDSLLHRTIHRLVEIASSSVGQQKDGNGSVAQLAARCLGEIGPCELHTLVVQPEEFVSAKPENPFGTYAGSIIEVNNRSS